MTTVVAPTPVLPALDKALGLQNFQKSRDLYVFLAPDIYILTN